MASDWDKSAGAWIAAMSDAGDWAREAVLDPAMLARSMCTASRRILDVGCGEGRFCRMLGNTGAKTVGIDPTAD